MDGLGKLVARQKGNSRECLFTLLHIVLTSVQCYNRQINVPVHLLGKDDIAKM